MIQPNWWGGSFFRPDDPTHMAGAFVKFEFAYNKIIKFTLSDYK